MTTSQYKNIIGWTLKHLPAEAKANSVTAANEILKNSGVPFLNKDCADIRETLIGNNYMGWEECTGAEAQSMANNGFAAIGINNDKVVIIKPETGTTLSGETFSEEESAENVLTVSELPLEDRMNMSFFSYTSTRSGGGGYTPPFPERIAQTPGDPDWDASIWYPYSNWAGSGCGVACTSMALSCIGISKTPGQIIEDQKDQDVKSNMLWWRHGNYIEVKTGLTGLRECWNRYWSNHYKYAPPILSVISRTTGKNHYIVMCSYGYDDHFRAVDPGPNGKNYDYWMTSDVPKNAQVIQYYK